VRSWRLAGAITLAIVALVLALMPFGRLEDGNHIIGSTTCGSPIVSAWRAEPRDSGWFGYAPLTSTPITVTPFTVAPRCRHLARERLLDAAVLAAMSLLLVRRPRWRKRPAGSQPGLIA